MDDRAIYIVHSTQIPLEYVHSGAVIVLEDEQLSEVKFYSDGHTVTKGERAYIKQIRALVRGYVTDVLDTPGFVESMYESITWGLTNAWHEGAKKAGLSPQDLSAAELAALQQDIMSEHMHVYGFTTFLATRAAMYAAGQKQLALAQSYNRAVQWTNRYDAVRVEAYTMAAGDQKLIWTLGATKDHCQSCLTFNGRVYRASTWQQYNALPKSPRLCCFGRHCDCNLTPTDQRITPGRFPEGALCN